MIIRCKQLVDFERDLLKEERSSFKRNLRLLDALYEEAVHLKVFPLDDPLAGLDIDIRIARIINNV